jgi:hypothetical protein
MWRTARVAAFVGVGILALTPSTAREAPLLPQAKSSAPLLGIAWSDKGRGSTNLVSVDPRSLNPVPGRALSLIGVGRWAYSPDRSRLALAGSCQIGNGLSGGIVFVDVARLRPIGCLWLGGISAMVWPGPRRLLAVTHEVVSIDPVSGRVLGRTALPEGQLLGLVKARSGLVLLLSSAGFSRLVVVDEQGGVRSVALDLPVGIQPREASFVRPGLAVDSARSRAFVVPETGPLAEVFLDTMAVEYRDLRESVSLLGRLAAWLEPTAQAKEFHPSALRTAVWLGNGMLAVAGERTSEGSGQPTGLMLIDTHTWSRRMLDRGVNGATVLQGRAARRLPRPRLRFRWRQARRPCARARDRQDGRAPLRRAPAALARQQRLDFRLVVVPSTRRHVGAGVPPP